MKIEFKDLKKELVTGVVANYAIVEEVEIIAVSQVKVYLSEEAYKANKVPIQVNRFTVNKLDLDTINGKKIETFTKENINKIIEFNPNNTNPFKK